MYTKAIIDKFEEKNSIVLPEAYVNFLLDFDSYKIDINANINLFDLEYIAEAYGFMQMKTYAPNFIPISFDGGGRVLLMEQKKESTVIYVIDGGCIGYVEDFYDEKIEDFYTWLKEGCKLHEDEDDSYFVDVVLIKAPKNLKTDLITLKKLFRINKSISELYNIAKNPPGVIANHLYSYVAESLAKEFGQPDIFEYTLSEIQD